MPPTPRRLSGVISVVAAGALFLGGGTLGLLLGAHLGRTVEVGSISPPAPGGASTDTTELIRTTGYRFISPLIECERSRIGQLTFVESKLNDVIRRVKEQKTAEHVSIYVRELNNGPWLGIGERAVFSPASLLKVPLMMTVLRLAERDPQVLSVRLTCPDEEEQWRPNIRGSREIVPGETYSVDELVDRMIVHSDNRAANLLLRSLNESDLVQTYQELGLPLPPLDGKRHEMTVRQYAGTFRILYNATFLSRAASEDALERLSRTEFRDGIVAGIPDGTPVAHKFGERGLETGLVQLHDCGIVYAPQLPYLICVMTQGRSFEELRGVVELISRTTYVSLTEHAAKH